MKNRSHFQAGKILHASVCLYALAAFILNLIRIFDNEFWGDEAYSIMLSRMTLAQMLGETASDVHPPLFYSFLMALRNLLGDHGWVYHLAALIPFALVLIFTVTLVYRRFGAGSAFIMITLCGISENAVNYNIEVRMYSLAFMFVLFSYYSLLIVLNGEKKGSLWFVLFSLGAAYSHYYALVSVAFFYLLLLYLVIRKRFELKKLCIIYAATIAGYLPWLIAMLYTFLRTSRDFWMTDIPGIKDVIKYFYLADNKWYSYIMFILTFAMVALVTYLERAKKSEIQKESVTWLISGIGAAVFSCVIGVGISHLLRPVFTLRYLYPVISVMWLVLASSVSFIKRKAVASILIAASSLIVFIPGYRFIYTYDRITDRICSETMEQVEEVVLPGDILITNDSHLDWILLDYYVPGHDHILAEDTDIELEAGGSYLLFWSDALTDEETARLNENGYEAVPEVLGGMLGDSVNIYRLR